MNGDGRSGEVDAFGQPVREPGPAAPRQLYLARALWIGAALVGLVRTFIQLSDRQMLVAELRRAAPDLGQDELDAAVNSGIMFNVLLAFATLGIYLMLSNRMLLGRNWARVVTVVLGSLNVAGTLLGVLGIAVFGSALTAELTGVAFGVTDIAFSLVIMCLDAAVVVLALHPSSNAFFRAVGRAGTARGHVPQR